MQNAKSWFFNRCASRTLRRGGLVAAGVLGSVAAANAQVTLVATNVVGNAEASFNTAGGIGLGILTFLVGLGAVMMGWRVARGRGK